MDAEGVAEEGEKESSCTNVAEIWDSRLSGEGEGLVARQRVEQYFWGVGGVEMEGEVWVWVWEWEGGFRGAVRGGRSVRILIGGGDIGVGGRVLEG